MGLRDIFKRKLGGAGVPAELMDIARSGNIDLPLSGDSEQMLGDMIGKGIFKDKPDFLAFIVKEYVKNDMGSMMSGDKMPPESAIMDIIKKSGIGEGYPEGDIKKMLVPLLVTAFFAIYKYMAKRKPAVKPA